MVTRRALPTTGGVRAKLVAALVVLLLVAGGAWWRHRLPAPHRALLGHWEKIRSDMPVENPEYGGTAAPLAGREVFISRNRYWRVTATDVVELRYRVSEIDADSFSLTQAVTNPDGEEVYFHVTFSDDRRRMHVATRVMTRGGVETLTAVYRKLDQRTRP